MLLTIDGWDNASRTHLLGVMAVTRRGGVHIDSVDTTGVDLMGKDWTLQQLKEQTEKLGGASKAVAAVLDSPSVNKAALKAFEQEQPTIAGLLCVCHGTSLFLKDVFDKLDFVKVTWSRVHEICKKFRAVKWLKEKLAHKQTSLPLKVRSCELLLTFVQLQPQFKHGSLVYKLFCKTRMGSKFFQLERAAKNNIAAMSVVCDPAYIDKYEKRIVRGRRAEETDDDESAASEPDIDGETLSEVLQRNKAAINDTQLWTAVDQILGCLNGAVCLLKQADSDKLMCGKFWGLMNTEHLRLQQFEMSNPSLIGVADLFYKRWEYMHHPVCSLAHVLHPDHNESDPLGDEFISADVDKMLKRYFPIAADRAQVQCSIDKYLARQDHFSTLDAEGVGLKSKNR